MVRFQQRMRKKWSLKIGTVFKLLKITFSYLGSASRESTYGIAANLILMNISMTTYNTYTMGLWNNQSFYL